MPERGLILTPLHRSTGRGTEIHLHVTLECGEPALVIDDRFRPYFFIRAADAEAALASGPSLRIAPTPLASFAGEPVVRIEVARAADLPPVRSRLLAAGVPTFEADVRPAYRYLIDRGIRGALAIDGPFERQPGVGRVYRNPELSPAGFARPLRVLSFDIETSPNAERLYAIASAGAGGERAMIVASSPVAGAETYPEERALLAAFLAHVRAADPDVITGWNVADFDLTVLLRAAYTAGLRCTLGRTEQEIEVRRDPGFTRDPRVQIDGRVVLDGLALVRGAYIRLDDYSLETASRTILGRGKLFGPDNRGAEIEDAYRNDPARLAAYNLEDARLVLAILERTHLIALTVQRSLRTGMPLDRVGAQIAAVDSLYLPALRSRGIVAPSVRPQRAESVGIAGGLVLDSRPGLYRNILVYDFKSLYPSLIRTFNIDPLTLVTAGQEADDAICTPGGASFHRNRPGVLPELVAALGADRARARAAGDAIDAQAIKILMNSFFGVLGSPPSRLFSPAVANAITRTGQTVLRMAVEAIERLGHRVIYGDTDSLFVDLGEPDTERATAAAEPLRAAIGTAVATEIEERFGCASHLELEFEKVYRRFLMPEVRSGAGGSKKRYAGLRADDTIEIVGLEAVRRDWSAVARRFQRELLDLVLHDRDVTPFIRTFVVALRGGAYDAELAYRTALRKPLEAYTRTTPPHVKAARRIVGPVGRVVVWLVTQAGPEPVGSSTAAPDYEHYVQHQLRPIADAVLRLLGSTDFDAVVGARRQLSLFDP